MIIKNQFMVPEEDKTVIDIQSSDECVNQFKKLSSDDNSEEIILNSEQMRNDFVNYQQELKEARRKAKLKFIDDYLEKHSVNDIPIKLYSLLRAIIGDIYDLKEEISRRSSDVKLCN